jgi:hypothetical protein
MKVRSCLDISDTEALPEYRTYVCIWAVIHNTVLSMIHTMYVCMYVCMSFIFRKSFTRYGNGHITNNKKHSNIE